MAGREVAARGIGNRVRSEITVRDVRRQVVGEHGARGVARVDHGHALFVPGAEVGDPARGIGRDV